MTLRHVFANAGSASGPDLLGGRFFSDLGPLRVMSRRLFEKIGPQEMTFGWTIEAQIAAANLNAAICEIAVVERRRIAGAQKVSGVSWRRTLSIGCKIVAAGYRTRRISSTRAGGAPAGFRASQQQPAARSVKWRRLLLVALSERLRDFRQTAPAQICHR